MRPVFVGYACNNACVFCAQGSLRRAQAEPADEAVLEGLARAVGEDSERFPVFIGGEPTLRAGLPAWIRHAKALGAARVGLQTNGRRLVYPAYARELAGAGLSDCEVSLQGSTAAMHDYHTGAPGSFAQTIGGIRQARRAGLEACVSVVITRSNFRHLEEIAVLAASAGARGLRFSPARPVGRALALRDRVEPSPELYAPHLEQALRRAEAAALSGGTFAGLGPVEPPASQGAADSPPASEPAKSAQPSGAPPRPKPGLRERRAARKRTGEELKAIFPALFEGERR